VGVSAAEIQAAGGLEKWIEKQRVNACFSREDGLREKKSDKADNGSGRKKNATQKQNSEHDEQVLFFKWAELYLPQELDAVLWATPNGGHRHKATAARMKAEGAKAGVPDIFFAHARLGFHGLFIEMKRKRGGRVSPEQREVMRNLWRQGYACIVCHGFEAAKNALIEYLEGDGQETFKPLLDGD
jgi:hypothetical protein